MIYLHTGQPGAGKSLYTVWQVRQRAEKEKRPVYFSGITDCRVPGWTELPDAADWASCPDGAIIVIDEAQRIFRPRHVGAQVPSYVAALETHRHHGLDIYVITQHPTLVEANVRRLVGTHRHIMRAFGAQAAMVHEWNEVRTDCDTKRDGSVSTTFRYPKEAFALYKSAEVHTHKARIPFRVFAVLLSPLILAVIGYSLYVWISARTDADKAAATVSKLAGTPAGKPSGSGGPAGGRPGATGDWLLDRSPRVRDLAYTAPVYDAVTAPTRAPYPAMCVSSSRRCVCYSQDGTRLDVGLDLCRRIVDRGFFKDWVDETEQRTGRAVRSPATGGQRPIP